MEEWRAALVALAEHVTRWIEEYYVARGAVVLHDKIHVINIIAGLDATG